MHAEMRSDDYYRVNVEKGVGDEGAGGDLGQASLTSCCLKQDTRAPLHPSTWITYLTHTNTQSVLHTCVDTDANANSILFGLILQSTHAHRALCRRPYIAVETECSLSCVAAL